MSERHTKTVDLSIEIDAPADVVWNAISDAEELQRWFPLSAAIEPGVGGSVTLGWGPDVGGTGTIDIWDEGRRLRYVESPYLDAAAGGNAAASTAGATGTGEEADAAVPGPVIGNEGSVPVAVDYRIESRRGVTVLRLVHSGFRADDDWAEYLDTIDSGWRYFLFNLKHYLERHRGVPRRMVWDRRTITLPKREAWRVLFGEGGLVAVAPAAAPRSVPPAAPGQFALAGSAAQLWSGHTAEITQVTHPIHVACRCGALDDALLLVELEPGSGAYSLGVWLSLYGVAEEQAQALETSLRTRLNALVS